MRRPKLVRQSGPYICHSFSQDNQGVRIVIYPAFPEYSDPGFDWAENRYKGKGGGPSIFTAMALAEEIAKFLNSPYDPEAVKDWKKKAKQLIPGLKPKLARRIARGGNKAGSDADRRFFAEHAPGIPLIGCLDASSEAMAAHRIKRALAGAERAEEGRLEHV